MNRTLVATARKKLLRRGRALLRGAHGATPVRSGGLGSMTESDVAELREIHSALERIERGIFGKCEDCQGPVEDERLEHRPWDRVCGTCAGVEADAPAPARASA